MHSTCPSVSMVASGERFPHALQAKSHAWMQAKSIDPMRPAAKGAAANGALHTPHAWRPSGAMIPHPGQMRIPGGGAAAYCGG